MLRLLVAQNDAAGSDAEVEIADVAAARDAMGEYRGEAEGEIAAALAVVGLSAERAYQEAEIRDDMIRVAHQSGVSLHQLAEVSGLGRKTVASIVKACCTQP